MSVEDVVDRFFRAEAAGDIDEMASIIRDDAQIWHNFDNQIQSKTEVLENLRATLKTVRLGFNFHHRLVTDGEVAVRYDTLVHMQERDVLVTPTAMFLRVEGDQIVSIHEYLDTSAIKSAGSSR